MQKVLLLLAVVGIAGVNVLGQTKKHFTVQDRDSCSFVNFYLKAASGTCEIRTRKGNTPINILGNHKEEYITSEFGQLHRGETLNAWLNLKDNGKEGFGTKVSKILGRKKMDDDNYWNIYFTDYKPYRLDLAYGVGKAYIDLSDIAVENLKVTSGNAHVKVGYLSKMKNKMEMDTFMVSVDLGDIEIERLNLARAKNILAEVGIGSLVLDFEESPLTSSAIWARVGAGSLEINLPADDLPIIIRLKGTSYRKFKVPPGYSEIRKRVFVSESYEADAENLLEFNIDVSMGSVLFAK
ncbi:DUF4097 family beta strand repeat-containing protein [Roseivirga misakiensis]|uniref:DUF2154 domain-containing protein n=1 Tax=Roseivirga misakiensis TaxID=1563681 RepID=A0A1E5T5E6_9BACT|nr:hypothetical protein [Roseivirga misakiensis]OEK06601.1 hypothetical protein BFP71_02730 [Roseivirga misakiensis]